MTNKIILELPDKTEVEAENISFIQLHGENNTVRLKVENPEKFKTQKGLLIAVYGSCNTINLGKIFYPVNDTIGLTGLTINIGNPPEDTLTPGVKRDADNCSIEIGDNIIVCGARLFLQESGTSISIGDDCMISWGIDIWCTDVHTVTDLEGNALNYSDKIEIGRHVWIGKDVKIGKNTKISDDSIIGWGSIVTKKFEEPNVVLAGNPAKIRPPNRYAFLRPAAGHCGGGAPLRPYPLEPADGGCGGRPAGGSGFPLRFPNIPAEPGHRPLHPAYHGFRCGLHRAGQAGPATEN